MANGTKERRGVVPPADLPDLQTRATFGLIRYMGRNSPSDLKDEERTVVAAIILGLTDSSWGVEALTLLAGKVEGLRTPDMPLKEIREK
jgi:hypothetical protein